MGVRSGQTIVIGGLMEDRKVETVNRVPILGSLPLIGHAFKRTQRTSVKTELLIFLTPRIIRSDADFELIKQVEAERLHFIEEEAEIGQCRRYGQAEEKQGQHGQDDDDRFFGLNYNDATRRLELFTVLVIFTPAFWRK